MPNIQIKNVPVDVHKVWKHRAVDAGQSLQEYLRAKLIADASVPTRDEWLRRLESRSGGTVTFGQAAEAIRAERDSR